MCFTKNKLKIYPQKKCWRQSRQIKVLGHQGNKDPHENNPSAGVIFFISILGGNVSHMSVCLLEKVKAMIDVNARRNFPSIKLR